MNSVCFSFVFHISQRWCWRSLKPRTPDTQSSKKSLFSSGKIIEKDEPNKTENIFENSHPNPVKHHWKTMEKCTVLSVGPKSSDVSSLHPENMSVVLQLPHHSADVRTNWRAGLTYLCLSNKEVQVHASLSPKQTSAGPKQKPYPSCTPAQWTNVSQCFSFARGVSPGPCRELNIPSPIWIHALYLNRMSDS